MQLIQPKAQKCSATTCPRKFANVSGAELIQPFDSRISGALYATRPKREMSRYLPSMAAHRLRWACVKVVRIFFCSWVRSLAGWWLTATKLRWLCSWEK